MASVNLRRPFEYVSIVPDEEHGSVGHLQNREFPISLNRNLDGDAKTKRRFERETTICFAGPVAEETFAGRKNTVGATEDRDQANHLGSCLHLERRFRREYLDHMLERTRQSVQTPLWWLQIEALAEALLETPKIGHSKVRAIVCTASKARRDRFVELTQQARLAERKAAGQNAKS